MARAPRFQLNKKQMATAQIPINKRFNGWTRNHKIFDSQKNIASDSARLPNRQDFGPIQPPGRVILLPPYFLLCWGKQDIRWFVVGARDQLS